MNKEIILATDDAAARHVTLTGWLSRDGFFYNDETKDAEKLARSKGATHKKCYLCDNLTEHMYCDDCIEKKKSDEYDTYEKIEWNGCEPIIDIMTGELFRNDCELENHCIENFEYSDEQAEDDDFVPTPEMLGMKLVFAEPVYLEPLKEENLFNHIYSDEYDYDPLVGTEIQEALSYLNKRITNAKIIYDYKPSKKAVK